MRAPAGGAAGGGDDDDEDDEEEEEDGEGEEYTDYQNILGGDADYDDAGDDDADFVPQVHHRPVPASRQARSRGYAREDGSRKLRACTVPAWLTRCERAGGGPRGPGHP